VGGFPFPDSKAPQWTFQTDILDLRKIEEGRLSLEITRFDLRLPGRH
jgi:hypothetical protein